jgi:hypothetical protein
MSGLFYGVCHCRKTYKKNPADFAMSFPIPTDQTKLGIHEEGLNTFENQGHV